MDQAAPPQKVAIGAIVRFAYRNVFGRIGVISELGWIMLLILLAASILPALLLPGATRSDPLRLDPLDYAQEGVTLLALSAFAVRWHQLILLGDPRRLPRALFFRAWLRFLIYGCILYAALGAILAVTLLSMEPLIASMTAKAVVALAALTLCWLTLLVAARSALLFPAAARGKPLGLGGAWRLMGGNSWRLVWASILTAAPLKAATFAVITILVAAIMPEGSEHPVTPPLGFVILIGVIETVSDMLLAALGASVLSGFYRELVAWRADGAAPAA
jgi:hypothetical protein